MVKKLADPKEIFYRYIPPLAVEYCFNLWKTHNFHFKITKSRDSKFGDFRYYPQTQSYTITVNADLNPFAFLITYLHEVAHLWVHLKYKNNVLPHGIEWKRAFQEVAKPMLVQDIFPSVILLPFINYLKNPKASSAADKNLFLALQFFNNNQENEGEIILEKILPEKKFKFKNRIFQKKQDRKSRVLCLEIKTGKQYLITKTAPVIPLL